MPDLIGHLLFIDFGSEGYGVSGGLRFAPAPPNVSCVICCANNLYPSGPSPYTCPGVDKPPDTPYPSHDPESR